MVTSTPPLHGHRVVGFGCGVIVSSEFADARISNPESDINSRIIASISLGCPVLPSRDRVARYNAGEGIDIVVLYGSCLRNEIMSAPEKQDALALLATTFAEWCAGFRLRRVICETADEQARRHIEASVVFRAVASFPEVGRMLFCMDRNSVNAMSSSLGNALFRFNEPCLKLRQSDQQLISAALHGSTDEELAVELGISFAAVKARWRSTLAHIGESRPELVIDEENKDGVRGKQKRHRVLTYMRSHPEELRPYQDLAACSARV